MNESPFAARTIGIVVAVAVLGFAAFLLLSAYAPDLRPGSDGGGHALSTSAVGFKGVVDMARGMGTKVALIRNEHALGSGRLIVATPGADATEASMRVFLTKREGHPTLVVLRKWQVQRQATNPAWVEQFGLLPEAEVLAPLHGLAAFDLCRTQNAQAMCGPHVHPILTNSDGKAFLAKIDNGPIWVLSDPDYLDNYALATQGGARMAMTVLRDMAPSRDLAFDLTLNGFGRQPNLLKLAFEPPFLALTLCLLAAVALALFHTLVRFGVPEREGRAVALGKRALAENIAALLRLARRSHRTGAAYATLVAESAGRASGSRLSGTALARYLDGLGSDDRGGGGQRFSDLAREATEARNEPALVAAAQKLHRWKGTIL